VSPSTITGIVTVIGLPLSDPNYSLYLLSKSSPLKAVPDSSCQLTIKSTVIGSFVSPRISLILVTISSRASFVI
jgi:hypothetical protein